MFVQLIAAIDGVSRRRSIQPSHKKKKPAEAGFHHMTDDQ